jgi:hypothetical protein
MAQKFKGFSFAAKKPEATPVAIGATEAVAPGGLQSVFSMFRSGVAVKKPEETVAEAAVAAEDGGEVDYAGALFGDVAEDQVSEAGEALGVVAGEALGVVDDEPQSLPVDAAGTETKSEPVAGEPTEPVQTARSEPVEPVVVQVDAPVVTEPPQEAVNVRGPNPKAPACATAEQIAALKVFKEHLAAIGSAANRAALAIADEDVFAQFAPVPYSSLYVTAIPPQALIIGIAPCLAPDTILIVDDDGSIGEYAGPEYPSDGSYVMWAIDQQQHPICLVYNQVDPTLPFEEMMKSSLELKIASFSSTTLERLMMRIRERYTGLFGEFAVFNSDTGTIGFVTISRGAASAVSRFGGAPSRVVASPTVPVRQSPPVILAASRFAPQVAPAPVAQAPRPGMFGLAKPNLAVPVAPVSAGKPNSLLARFTSGMTPSVVSPTQGVQQKLMAVTIPKPAGLPMFNLNKPVPPVRTMTMEEQNIETQRAELRAQWSGYNLVFDDGVGIVSYTEKGAAVPPTVGGGGGGRFGAVVGSRFGAVGVSRFGAVAQHSGPVIRIATFGAGTAPFLDAVTGSLDSIASDLGVSVGFEVGGHVARTEYDAGVYAAGTAPTKKLQDFEASGKPIFTFKMNGGKRLGTGGVFAPEDEEGLTALISAYGGQQ